MALSGRGLSARPGQLSGAKRTFAPDQRTSSKVIHCGGAVFRCDRARRKGDEWHANGAEIALHGLTANSSDKSARCLPDGVGRVTPGLLGLDQALANESRSLLKKVLEGSRCAMLIQNSSGRRTKDSHRRHFVFGYCASSTRLRVFQQTASAIVFVRLTGFRYCRVAL